MPYLGKEPARVPVTASDIPDNSITAAKIIDGAITVADIANDAVTADKLANSINTDIATGVTANTTANAALPKAGGTMTGVLNVESAENALAYFKSTDPNANIRISDSNSSDINQVGIGATGNDLTLIAGGDNRVTIDSSGTITVVKNAVGTMTTDNDGSFAMSASNNFKCTPTGNFTLTFTAIVAQSGNILLVNSGGHTVAAHGNTKVDANLLATVSTAGTYLLSYFSDGTNVYMTNSAIYT